MNSLHTVVVTHQLQVEHGKQGKFAGERPTFYHCATQPRNVNLFSVKVVHCLSHAYRLCVRSMHALQSSLVTFCCSVYSPLSLLCDKSFHHRLSSSSSCDFTISSELHLFFVFIFLIIIFSLSLNSMETVYS